MSKNEISVIPKRERERESGRDILSLSLSLSHIVTHMQLPGGLDWVECKPCSAEECPPGEFNYRSLKYTSTHIFEKYLHTHTHKYMVYCHHSLPFLDLIQISA